MAISHKEKHKSEWTFGEWEGWVNEALDMYRLALQHPTFLRVEMWREEYDRRKSEQGKMLAENMVAG